MVIDEIDDAPWDNNGCGDLVSVDGCDTSRGDKLKREDVELLIAYGEQGDTWDGESAGIAKLADGRFIAWESFYGPTGSGFSCDAYGGDADILFGQSVTALLPHITERSREMLEWAEGWQP